MTDRVEWVEIIEPKTQRPMYGNLRTGELAWEPPSSAKVKKRDNNQWWELFDPKTSRFYYYNEMLQKTVWHRPTNCDIIPLAKLQTLKLNTEARQDDAEVHKHKQQHSQRHRHRHREDNRHARHHHHHHQHQGPRGLPHDNERMDGDGQAELIGQPVRQRRASDQVERSRFNELATAHSMGYHHQGVMHGSPRGQRSQRYVQEMPGMQIPPNMQQQPQYPLPQVPYAHQGRMRSDSEPMDISKVRGDMQGQPPNFGRYPSHGRGGYDLGSVGRSAGHAIQEVMQREGSGGNISQGSDHSQERHRPDSRASQSSHQSTEGYGPQRRRSLEMQGQHVHERSDSQVSTVSQGEERHRTAPSPRSKKKKQMPKMGVTAAMQRTFGGPTSPNANLPHSQSGDRLQHFFGQPPRNQLPPQIQTQPPNTQGFIGPGYHRSDQESPRLASPMDSSFSPPGSNNFNRTATPDSSSSLDSSSQYPSTKDRHLVPSYGAGFPDQRGEHIVHKHSDSQLSQNSQTSISSHHSDSSNRPVTSDSQRSQSSEDLNGPTYVHVGPPSQEDQIFSHRHSPAMQAPNNNLPPQLSTDTNEIMPSDPIYANLEFIAQREKEDEQRMVLREMDRLSGAQDIEIKIHRNVHSGSPMGRINGEHENRSYSLEALDQHEQLAKAGIRLNKSFDSEESSSRDASVTHESSPMNTPGSPPSPTPHDTHSMESPVTETVHASLQRGHHRGSTTSSTSGVNMIQNSVFERSISVQDQRPISMQKTGTVPHGLKNSPSLIAITRGGNKKGIPPGENDLENVAPDNLNRHKKGLFRKKISLSNMLSWTKEPIRKSMLMTEDKAVKREAPEVFKLTQCYMGDRVIKGHTRDNALLDLVVKGWSIVPLRDEVYIQVCRQTSENYQEDSLRSGWELMAILLYFFPPSVSFHPYLESFIAKHLTGDFDTRKFVCCVSQVTVKDYAEQCMKRLDRVAQFGARKGNKKISADEIAIAKNSIFFPSLFGNTLEEALELQKDRFPDYSLPWIVVVLSEEVLRLNGQRCEGIFRVPGDIDEVNSLKLKCDQWVHPECSDPHVPASLLKQWYRDLYTPLIPDEFYERCIIMCNDKDGALEVVEDLPDLNRHVLSHFIRFLQIFAHEEHVALTKMDVNNLAMVMAPNCLRCISDQPEIIFENTRKEMSFVRLLIQYLDTSYMVDIR